MKEYDYTDQTEVTCPHCGWKNRRSCDISMANGEEGEFECCACDKPFSVTCEITRTFTSHFIGAVAIGDSLLAKQKNWQKKYNAFKLKGAQRPIAAPCYGAGDSQVGYQLESYLEDYIIAEVKEEYRINSFWHYWFYRGLLAAIDGDARIVVGWEITE